MKKRKISLGVVLLGTVIFTVLTIFISKIIGNALEKEIEQLFPQLAAESNIDEVDFSFIKGVFLKNLDMQFILEKGDTCKIKANKLHLGIEYPKFVFQKGKIKINKLKVDSLHVFLPSSFDSINAIDLESDIKSALRKLNRRGIVSNVFLFLATNLNLEDSGMKNVTLDKLKIRKKGGRDLYVNLSEITYDEMFKADRLKLHLKKFAVSSSATLSNENLLFSVGDSANLNELVEQINLSSRKLRYKLNSLIKFDFLRFSCKRFNTKEWSLKDGSNLNISIAGSDDIINFGINCDSLRYEKHIINKCSFNLTADDVGVVSRDIKIITPKESLELSGILSLKNGEESNAIFSFKGIDFNKIKKYLNINRSLKLSGVGTFNGLFKGFLKERDSWRVITNAKVRKFNAKYKTKLKKEFLKVDYIADSLYLDSVLWEKGELSGGYTFYIDDSVGYNSVFSLDVNRKTLFVSRVYSVPVSLGKEKFRVTSSAINAKVDTLISETDTILTLRNISTEILRLERESRRKFYYKRYRPQLSETLKLLRKCDFNIGLFSFGNDSLSIVEAKSVKFSSDETLNSNLKIASLSFPQKALLTNVNTSFTFNMQNKLKVGRFNATKVHLDTLPLTFKKFTNKSLHVELTRRLKKLKKWSSEKTEINVTNLKVKFDSTNIFSAKKVDLNLTSIDSAYSNINIRRVKLPDIYKDSKIGQNVKTFKTSFRIKKKILSLKNFKLDADGTRYYCDGNVTLHKYLPCSLNTNIENIKLFRNSRDFLKDSTVIIRGGAYGRLKFKGKLLKPKSWKGKGSILLKNLHVENIPMQKIEIVTKYAPPFARVKFKDIDMNPIVLKPGGKIHVKAVDAKGKSLNFKGWGSMDFKGRFYFEMNGKVKAETVDKLPNLTQLALNKGDSENYGKFNAKMYGSTKRQYLIPEKGIHGKVIRSKFRQMGASFRNLFN